MQLKKADDKAAALAELEALAKSAGSGKRREIEEELRTPTGSVVIVPEAPPKATRH
jgi:hypothetical protein